MQYFYTRSVRVQGVAVPTRGSVVLFEPERVRAGIYEQKLLEEQFQVTVCHKDTQLLALLDAVSPHILVCAIGQGSMHEVLRPVFQSFPNLLVITLGEHIDDAGVRQLMELGVSGHLNRHLSKPRDVAVMAIQLLIQ